MSEGCWELNKSLDLNEIANNSFSVSFDSLAPARLIRRFSQPASPSELPVGSLSRPSPRSRFALRGNLRLLYLKGPAFSIVVNHAGIGIFENP